MLKKERLNTFYRRRAKALKLQNEDRDKIKLLFNRKVCLKRQYLRMLKSPSLHHNSSHNQQLRSSDLERNFEEIIIEESESSDNVDSCESDEKFSLFLLVMVNSCYDVSNFARKNSDVFLWAASALQENSYGAR